MNEPWWKRSAVYQIYPKSFRDTDGDGIGDLPGIISKLDYLAQLGVGGIWLTPIYRSPQKDNGYDISDYFNIYEPYGTMADFDRLVAEAHKRGLKVIMDIVVNHTSTEHHWFQRSREAKESPYRDFYIWRDAPTNWVSKFGGSAWEFDGQTGQYYLHLFDVTQADLNWENGEVRSRVYEMMRFWLEKGVDGFRLDVINLISKEQRFPNDEGDGRRFYTDGPRIDEFLHEMNREVFARHGAMTVGEMSSTTIEHCIGYTRPERQELDMVFSFHHLKVDYPGGQKWVAAEFDFLALKRILSEWQVQMHRGGGWNALFWSNHDQPRVVSRFGSDGAHHRESAKMLATVMLLMQGTPFIYQGEEIGMTNPGFRRIEEYRDVESLNVYRALLAQGRPEGEVLEILRQKSRDNGRSPMQWDATANAGFSSAAPWIGVAPSYREINVERALADQDSVFYHYQRLLELRRERDVVVHGDYQLILEEHDRIFAYIRRYRDEGLLVVSNFFGTETEFQLPDGVDVGRSLGEVLLTNYADPPERVDRFRLRPYESVVFRFQR